MKTIFISSYHGLISRNILQTEVFEILRIQKDLQIVILVPQDKVDFFTYNFGGGNVVIEGVENRENPWNGLLDLISVSLISSENLFIHGLLNNKRYLKFYFANFIHFIFGKVYAARRVLCYIYNFFPVNSSVKYIFRKYNPDLVFSTDIYHPDDRELVKESKRRGVSTVGMVRSWDNVTTKGVMLAIPDKIIVNNEVLKYELKEYNKIDAGKIFIMGIPHYDKYGKQPDISKDKFFREMGLDPNKKVILFAPAGTILYKSDGEVLKLLKLLKNDNVFSRSVQFLVRLPVGSGIYLNDFKADRDFIFDNPGFNVAGGSAGQKYSELTKEGAQHLINSLYYSDIAITLTSTIAIDATAFDTPAIIYSIRRDQSDDIKKFLRYTHYKKFVSFGFCKLATSTAELVEQINMYLENPGADRDKREKLIEKYCYKLDGNSSKRVARLLLESIHLS